MFLFRRFIKKAVKKAKLLDIKVHPDNFGEGEKEALNYYFQYNLISKTWWLTLATWILAIATIVLVYFSK